VIPKSSNSGQPKIFDLFVKLVTVFAPCVVLLATKRGEQANLCGSAGVELLTIT